MDRTGSARSSVLVSPGNSPGVALRLGRCHESLLQPAPQREAATCPTRPATTPPAGGGASWVPPMASASFREMVPVGTRARFPPLHRHRTSQLVLQGQLCGRGHTCLSLFSISSHPGQVPHAPVQPLGPYRLAPTELSTWEAGLSRTGSPLPRVLRGRGLASASLALGSVTLLAGCLSPSPPATR